jgi:hypothetical protein
VISYKTYTMLYSHAWPLLSMVDVNAIPFALLSVGPPVMSLGTGMSCATRFLELASSDFFSPEAAGTGVAPEPPSPEGLGAGSLIKLKTLICSTD